MLEASLCYRTFGRGGGEEAATTEFKWVISTSLFMVVNQYQSFILESSPFSPFFEKRSCKSSVTYSLNLQLMQTLVLRTRIYGKINAVQVVCQQQAHSTERWKPIFHVMLLGKR